VGPKAGMNVRRRKKYLARTGDLTRMVLAGRFFKREIFVAQIMDNTETYCVLGTLLLILRQLASVMPSDRVGSGLEPQALW